MSPLLCWSLSPERVGISAVGRGGWMCPGVGEAHLIEGCLAFCFCLCPGVGFDCGAGSLDRPRVNPAARTGSEITSSLVRFFFLGFGGGAHIYQWINVGGEGEGGVSCPRHGYKTKAGWAGDASSPARAGRRGTRQDSYRLLQPSHALFPESH